MSADDFLLVSLVGLVGVVLLVEAVAGSLPKVDRIRTFAVIAWFLLSAGFAVAIGLLGY